MEFLIGEIRTARKRLSEIHMLMQRTYLDSERTKLREEEKEIYGRIDLAEAEGLADLLAAATGSAESGASGHNGDAPSPVVDQEQPE